MSYLWCKRIGMWCGETDEEEHEYLGCDGECGACEESESVNG